MICGWSLPCMNQRGAVVRLASNEMLGWVSVQYRERERPAALGERISQVHPVAHAPGTGSSTRARLPAPAINAVSRARNPRGAIRSKICNQLRDLFGLTDAAQRMRGAAVFEKSS